MSLGLLRAVVASLCCIVGAAGSRAAIAPSLSDLEAITLQRLNDEPDFTERIGGVVPLDDAKEAAREYLFDLFRDDAFVRPTKAWLQSSSAGDKEALQSEWALHYRQTLVAGFALLTDDEIDFIARSSMFRGPFIDQDTCVKISAEGIGTAEVAALMRSSKAELKAYFRILKRVYLAALANEIPRPMPAEQAMLSAQMKLLMQIPEADRERLLKRSGAGGAGGPQEDCAVGKIYITALNAAPGETGRLLRRDHFVRMLRSVFEPPGPASATSSVQGAASGQFQPGAAQLDYPVHAANAGIEGTMRVRIWVDEQGRATRVKTIERDFNKPAVTLADGSQIGVEEMFDPVVVVFYKAGRFMPRFKDGKPQAYIVEVPINWKLE